MKINIRSDDSSQTTTIEKQSNSMNLDVDANSTFLNPAINSKKKLIEWVLTMLGAPLVTVELNEVQFDAIIGDAIELYTKYAWFGDRYLLLDLNEYVPGIGLDTKKYRITNVIDIATNRDTIYGNAMADPFFGFNAYLNGGNGASWGFFGGSLAGGIGNVNGYGYNFGGGFITFHMANEFLQMARRLSGNNPDFSFDRLHQKLILYPEPRFLHQKLRKWKRWILLTCEIEPTLEELYGNNYLKRIVLAKAKILLGTIRSKFQNVQLVGGGSIDTSIKEEGQAELDKILEEIRNAESKGNQWYFA